jgi:hypothetical protein
LCQYVLVRSKASGVRLFESSLELPKALRS